MLNRRLLTMAFGALWAATLSAFAQLPTDLRSEQIFISPHEMNYRPGDTIRTEGFITCRSNADMSPHSRYVYVELISEGRNILARQKVPCNERGYFRADIPTDTLSSEGEYWIRAYTRLMRNFSTESFAHHSVNISRKRPLKVSSADDAGLECYVSVPGGALVEGVPQNIHVVIRSSAGVPEANVPVCLLGTDGDTIATAVSSMSGYVTFAVLPNEGDHYSVSVPSQAGSGRVEVPAVDLTAVKIQGTLSGRRLNYEIVGDRTQAKNLHMYIYDYRNGMAHIASPPPGGSIHLELSPQTVTMFLTDDSCSVVSEFSTTRLLPEKGRIKVEKPVVSGETIDFDLENIALDSTTHIMARIIPADNVTSLHATDALWYLTDFSNDLPFPLRLHSSSDAEAASDLAAWLATARFRRFRLKDVTELNDSAIYTYMPETVMELNGTARRYEKYPVKKGSIVAYNGDSFAAYEIELDRQGRFSIPVDDFEDGCEFMLQYVNPSGTPELVDLSLDNDSFPSADKLPRRSGRATGHLRRSGFDPGSWADTGYQLPDVVVKARIRSEQSTSTRSYYAVKLKDRETIERRGYRTLRDIIRDMPFLRLRYDTEGNWSLQTNRGTAILGASTLKYSSSGKRENKPGGGSEIALLVDGTRYDHDMFGLLMEMPADDIESVEQLAPYEALAYAAFAVDGALVVTTRNAVNKTKRKSRGAICRPMGLTLADGARKQLAAPSRAGEYRLLIDIIGSDGVHSLEHPLRVE